MPKVVWCCRSTVFRFGKVASDNGEIPAPDGAPALEKAGLERLRIHDLRNASDA